MPGPGLELAEEHLAQDGDAVRPVEGDGRQVEDGRDGGVGAQPDEVDERAADGEEPDGVEGRGGGLVHLVPHARQREHLVARVGPHGAGPGLDGGDADEVEDDERGDGEEDTARGADVVVEDLGRGLGDGRGEGGGDVAGAVGEDDGEEPAADVGEAERGGDGPRGFELGVLDFFGDVGRGVVVGHCP